MSSEILINIRPSQTRIAFVEDKELRDLKVDRRTSRTMVGSIYKGRISKVIPGMQAAFVDLGLSRSGFLYVRDVAPEKIEAQKNLYLEEELSEESGELEPDTASLNEADKPEDSKPEVKQKIEELLKKGQEVMIQVAKDPLGTKGARITNHISLAGRFMVYLPLIKHFGISRKIEDLKERERLKRAVVSILPKKGGVILRTAAEGVSPKQIKEDFEYLKKLWKQVQKNYEKRKTLGVVYEDLDIELRTLRDLLSKDVDKIYVDNASTYKKINQFITQYAPSLEGKASLYTKSQPLFDLYDLDLSINQALQKKIWLKSGGSIVFDETEALVAIDVNTGRYLGKKDLEETLFNTNMEACKEIANQLRIRNCGGIIIIDFIDMEKETHRKRLLEQLQEEIKKDRTKVSIVSMSDLGLVQMTRKRIRPSLLSQLCQTCHYCQGTGYLKSPATVSNEVFRALERELTNNLSRPRRFFVHCHREVADWIYNSDQDSLEFIEKKMKASVIFKTEPSFHREEFEVFLN